MKLTVSGVTHSIIQRDGSQEVEKSIPFAGQGCLMFLARKPERGL